MNSVGSTLLSAALYTHGDATRPTGQRGLRQTNDYGYIALQREAGCISEELWTGMNYESIASLAAGGRWSQPNAYA
jgi:hypothetical protein